MREEEGKLEKAVMTRWRGAGGLISDVEDHCHVRSRVRFHWKGDLATAAELSILFVCLFCLSFLREFSPLFGCGVPSSASLVTNLTPWLSTYEEPLMNGRFLISFMAFP